MIIGSGFLGTPALITTTVNHELVPPKPANWTMGYNCYKFSLDNESSCTIKINGGSPMFLKAGQGYNTETGDALVWSFVIVEAGVVCNFSATY